MKSRGRSAIYAAGKVLEASETVEAAATSLQRGIQGFLGRVAV
jgi:hypothetical protein